jgi:chorismate-pyruvate lyase
MRNPIRLIRGREPERGRGVASKKGVLYPLDVVYAQAGVDPPRARVVRPDDIPPPYRSLLVHERDMTLTLEAHFGGRVALRALSTFSKGRSYYRRVLLVQEYSGRPVEMGAIRIDIDVFEPKLRARILRNQVPLGRVLRDGGVDYRSRPRVFLSVTPNSEMMGVFWMRESRPLWGRQTEVTLDGKKIGDIVEILPLA